MNVKFSAVSINARFVFCDQVFIKISFNLAEDTEGIQHIFDSEIEVEVLIGSRSTNANCDSAILEKTP